MYRHFEKSDQRFTFPFLWVEVSSIDEHLKKIKELGGEVMKEKGLIGKFFIAHAANVSEHDALRKQKHLHAHTLHIKIKKGQSSEVTVNQSGESLLHTQ